MAGAVAEMLAKRGVNIILADWKLEGVRDVSKDLSEAHGIRCTGVEVDVADWEQQAAAFREASSGTRIEFVFVMVSLSKV